MGASLRPVLANIIMREFEKVIADNRYVDPLFCGNGKQPGSVHLLIQQRTYVQKKTFQKNSN